MGIVAEIHDNASAFSNPQIKRRVFLLLQRCWAIKAILVVVSQFLWLYIFTTLLWPFDCARVEVILRHGHSRLEFPPAFTNATMVMEMDFAVECYTGWHLPFAVHGIFVALLFGALSAPLLIV